MDALRIEGYDMGSAPPAALSALVEHSLANDREMGDDDPPRRPEDVWGYLETGWGEPWRQRHLLAWRGEEALGSGMWSVDVAHNPANVWLGAFVLPDHRRQGVGRRLLAAMLAEVGALGVTVAGFCLRPDRSVGVALRAAVEDGWGLAPRMVERKARLDLAGLDRAWLAAALAERRERVGERFRLLFFPMNAYPPAETGFSVASYLDLLNEVETLMPLEDITQKPERFDAERLDSTVERQRKRDRVLWQLVALEPGGGACVGYTTINFKPDDPALVHQWGTGVARRAQGHGLGKLLKLAMLEKLVAEVPGARYVETSNAGSNAAMIGINADLGFHEHYRLHCYQLPLAELEERLGLNG